MALLHSFLPALFLCSFCLRTASAFMLTSSDAARRSTMRMSPFSERAEKYLTRSRFFQGILITSTTPALVNAFEGGVGGLGKTKPQTGVELFEEGSAPIQNQEGLVSAEIKSSNGKPILVQFQTPWPLLPTTSGLEARDLRSSESAFVQVVEATPNWENPKVFKQILIDTVFASQGKFGAYGTPVDIKVKPLLSERNDTFSVTFVSYTPAMRESERQVWIKPKKIDNTLVLLIAGTTKTRFSSQEKDISRVLDSFQVIPAPESKLRR